MEGYQLGSPKAAGIWWLLDKGIIGDFYVEKSQTIG